MSSQNRYEVIVNEGYLYYVVDTWVNDIPPSIIEEYKTFDKAKHLADKLNGVAICAKCKLNKSNKGRGKVITYLNTVTKSYSHVWVCEPCVKTIGPWIADKITIEGYKEIST